MFLPVPFRGTPGAVIAVSSPNVYMCGGSSPASADVTPEPTEERTVPDRNARAALFQFDLGADFFELGLGLLGVGLGYTGKHRCRGRLDQVLGFFQAERG